MTDKKALVSSSAPSRSLRGRVRRFIAERELIAPGDRLLAGVSGGPDSSCLLVVLASLRRSLRFELFAAHYDHGLRGRRAAAREERFVRDVCASLGVPLRTGAGDVRSFARSSRRSIEDAARVLRYEFLAETGNSFGCNTVAVGHTKDDQAETVLMRLVRGSGLSGLAAMTPSARWPLGGETPRVVRPLFALSRADTEACCAAAGLVPVEDPSNRLPDYQRNRVRHELLPLLRTFNPRIDDALLRLAENASADVELMEAIASEAIDALPAPGDGVRISRARFRALPAALQRHVVRLAAARLIDGGLSERHTRALLHAAEGRTGTTLDLPRRLHAEVQRDALVLSAEVPTATLPSRSRPLAVPGETPFGAWRVEADLLQRPPKRLTRNGAVAHLDADACGRDLRLRRRRAGDRFQPLGMDQPKKLQDFFVDAHVPRSERDAVPLLCGEGGIALVAGRRPAEWAKVTPRTRRVLRVAFHRIDRA